MSYAWGWRCSPHGDLLRGGMASRCSHAVPLARASPAALEGVARRNCGTQNPAVLFGAGHQGTPAVLCLLAAGHPGQLDTLPNDQVIRAHPQFCVWSM